MVRRNGRGRGDAAGERSVPSLGPKMRSTVCSSEPTDPPGQGGPEGRLRVQGLRTPGMGNAVPGQCISDPLPTPGVSLPLCVPHMLQPPGHRARDMRADEGCGASRL